MIVLIIFKILGQVLNCTYKNLKDIQFLKIFTQQLFKIKNYTFLIQIYFGMIKFVVRDFV
ncbi:hypothetical protein C4Q31_02015 [Leptospira borgpetersenii serovar Ceylonica]|uniref:Uncharacterized protein n=1 Tax=Leptospira borgpetersenii serovar Ballum TaxID=280505 RepID=A0A0E3B4H0_LEPBO|nr:hypothetical protein LBBP_01802 [Leptospira borgpetersenii serovar Ballum]ANH00833.1 Uncharacterized protein LB4E_1462 [Leptospira borgpetersenii str. 4E]AXX14519.1 hypothetical protein C4Q31_02015 [Leptospira borgpetersenii serovar Ceylonica]QHE26825.1 hypothetical protein GS524_07380 [Leptospira borgpetersenii]KGE22266.1 hypothetical protein IQ66_17520 [Leptospira borgpetersenii serovar Ballum]